MSRIKAINALDEEYAAANGHVYLDYFSPMLDATGVMKAELTADDLHPNCRGLRDHGAAGGGGDSSARSR